MPVASFENTLKLTPSAVTFAPSGALAPTPIALVRSRNEVAFIVCSSVNVCGVPVRRRRQLRPVFKTIGDGADEATGVPRGAANWAGHFGSLRAAALQQP
jgi:hypothetical protein